MTEILPRTQNGHTDDGSPALGTEGKRCPNCGSSRFKETISKEHCPDCGLLCDYWGGGSNEVYDNMMDAQEQEREEEQKCREEDW